MRIGTRHAQRGFGLLEAALITLLIGGALIAGYVAFKSRTPSLAAETHATLLAEADRALAAFAARHARLPCPDTDRDGFEDCGVGAQKGWLPYRTLGREGAGAEAGIGRLRYLVQRAAVDLTQAEDVWQPVMFKDNTEKYAARRSFTPPNIGTPDLCHKLMSGPTVPLAATHAQIGGANPRPVAYALAHPGSRDADGDGSEFDGVNAGGAAFEPPERQSASGGYDDRVAARGYGDLALALDCPRLNASLDMVSMAAEAVEEVNDQKVTNTALASVLTAINLGTSVIQGVKALAAAATMSTAVGYLSTATAALATAIGTCVVIVGCAEIPHAAASVAAATAAIVAAGAAIATYAASIPPYVVAGGMTLAAAIQAGMSTQSNLDLSQAVNQAYNAWQDAIAKKNDAYQKLQQAQSNETSTLAAKNAAWNTLVNEAHTLIANRNSQSSTDTDMAITANDGYITDVHVKLEAWQNAEFALAQAEEQLKKAQSSKSSSGDGGQAMADTIAQLDQMIASELDPARKQALIDAKTRLQQTVGGAGDSAAQLAAIDQSIQDLNNQIADLNARIASESDATIRNNLILQRDTLITQRDRLMTQRSELVLDVASATAQRDAARSARDSAQASYASARQWAIDVFYLQYAITTCTTDKQGNQTCTTNTYWYDGRSAIAAKIDDYANKYKDWYAKGRATQTAQQVYDEAMAAETRAKDGYDTLNALATGANPGSNAALTVWNGAEAILRAADAKGGIR